MSTRLEQIKQALINADRAGNTEDARRLAQAYREEEQRTVLQAGEQLQADAARFREEQEANKPREIGGLERFGREALAGPVAAGAFLQGAIVDPVANAIEWAEAGITGREPQYRSRFQEGMQASQNVRMPEGTQLAPGLVNEVLGGAGGAVGMLPEMLIPGAAVRRVDTAFDAARALEAAANPSRARQVVEATQQGVRQELPGSLAAFSIAAPRQAVLTEQEALEAGATPTEARMAALAEMGATLATGVVPISAAGGLASRAAQGAAGNISADLATQSVVNPLLPDELAAQRQEQMLSAGNLATQGGIGAALGAAFGARRAPTAIEQGQQAAAGLRELSGIEAATRAELEATEAALRGADRARRQEEEDKAFNETLRRQQEASPLPPRQEEMFPEPEPLMRDMLSGELGPAIPRNTAVAPTPELTALEQTATQARTRADELDAEIDALVEQKAQIVPTGTKGGYTRQDRVKIDRFDRQILDLQNQQRQLRQQSANAEADAMSLRLDLEPEQSGRTPEEIRREYLLQMQSRQFDAAERARLGEMEGQGATAEGAVFQPTKPRIRVQPEPEQGTLPLPKPRVRAGEDFSQQPALGPEGVTGQLNLQPRSEQPAPTTSAPTEPAAPTPQPTPQTPRTEAPRAATVETPAEALAAETVTRQEIDPVTGETIEVRATVVDRNSPKVKQLEAFFRKANTPRAEPLDPSEIERVDNLVASGRQPITAENNIIPVEQRRPTDVEQKLAGARTAKEAIQALKTYAAEGTPFRRIMDVIDQSPFLNDTAFRIAQPEDTAPNYMPDFKNRGVHAEKTDGTAEVIVKGSGYRVNGVTTPEVALHEIVHAASVSLMKGVDAGLIKDPRAVRAVNDVEAIRKELKASLEAKETREGLTQAERVNLDYATTNSREFVAQALSSKAMQQGLKKANLFTRLVDAIRRMFGGARSDQRLWERLASASLRVVQEQTRLEPEVRAARSVRVAQAKAQMDAKRRAEVDRAPDAIPDEDATPAQEGVVLGPRLGRAEPISQWGRFTVPLVGWEVSLQEIGYNLFAEGGGQAAVIQRARELVSGLQNEMKYIALSQTNTMVAWRDQARTQKDRDYRDGLMKKWLEAKDDAARESISNKLPEDVQKKLRAVRQEIDQMSKSIGREIFNATDGRELTDREEAVLETIMEQIGRYVSRSYQMFTDKGYGKRTVDEYEAGKKLLEKNSKLPESKRLSNDQIAEKAGPGFDRVRIFVDTVAGRISRLPERLEAARREAEAGGFEPHETQIRNDLKEDYAILIGNPTGRSVKEMFDALVDYSDTVMSKGVADNFRGVAESIAYDMLGQTDAKSAQNRYRYLQALRADDTVLRKRENVNRVVRNLWGEVEGGVASSMITLTRMASTLGSLKALNDIKTNSPDLFSKVRVDNKTTQIPMDIMRYGALAGMWTDSMTAEGIRGFSEAVTPTNELVDAAARLHGFVKGANVVWNPRAWIMDMGGLLTIPLANGNLGFANMKDSLFKKSTGMVATAFRKDYNAEMARFLRLGLIDPSATAGIRRETTQAKADDGARRQGAKFWNTVKDAGSALREAKEFLETSPKVANFLYHFDFYLNTMNPELGKKYENHLEKGGPWTEADQVEFARIEEYAADLTNKTNLTFSRVPNFPRKTERWHLSSFAVYMYDTMRVMKNNFIVGVAEVQRGLQMNREGSQAKGIKLVEHGAKRLIGASLAMSATPIIWTSAYMASPKFLGMTGAGLAGTALLRGLAEGEDEDELLEQQARVAAIASQIPFSTKANSYVLHEVKDDGTVVFIDAGRFDTYDPITGPTRAIVAGMADFARDGNTDKLEGALDMFSGMYFEGGLLSSMAFTALDAVDAWAKGTPFERMPSMERKAPDVMNEVYEGVSALTGGVVTPEKQQTALVLAQPAIPALIRNVPAAIEKSDEGTLEMLNALAGGVSSEFNIKDSVAAKATQFQREFRNARQNELRRLVLRQSGVSDKELASAYAAAAEREMEAVKTMREAVSAYRAWNEMRNKPADDGLQDWLKTQGRLSGPEIAAVMGDTFEPLPIDKDFLKQQTEARIRRGTGITTGYRLEGPELTRDRVAKLQRIREQWIKDNLN